MEEEEPTGFHLELLDGTHALEAFDCKHEPRMNEWLKTQALSQQDRNASRVYVLLCSKGIVRAFFTLSGHVIQREEVTARDRWGKDDPPRTAQLLGRFATDVTVKGHDVGSLLMDLVFQKYLEIIKLTTCGYLCLHAKSPWHVEYYSKRFGFKAPGVPPTDGSPTFMYLKTSAIVERFQVSAQDQEESA